jgi:hypothetical protein
MAATVAQVKALTGSTLVDATVQIFLDTALLLLGQISECTAEVTQACLDNAAVYLAAHLLVTSSVGQESAMITKEALGGKYSVEYLLPAVSGDGILGTPYGRVANTLTRGCLAEHDKRPVGMYSIGSIGC